MKLVRSENFSGRKSSCPSSSLFGRNTIQPQKKKSFLQAFCELSTIERVVFALAMLIVLILLTSFSLIGEAEHEHLSLGLMAMMFLHLIFTRSNPVSRSKDWTKNIFAISFGLCCLSGVALSRYDLPFFPELNQIEEIRIVHFMSAYWCIVLAAIHVGEQTKTIVSILPKILSRIGRVVVYAMSIYGVFVLCTTRFVLFLVVGKAFGEADYSVGLGVFFLQLLAVFMLIAVVRVHAEHFWRHHDK